MQDINVLNYLCENISVYLLQFGNEREANGSEMPFAIEECGMII